MKADRTLNILEVFQGAIKKKDSIFAWNIFNEQVLKAELKIVSVKKDRGEISLRCSPESLNVLEDMISGLGKLNFIYPESSLFFCAELKKLTKEGELKISLPESTLFYDRRTEGERINPEIPISVSFIHKDKPIYKACHDLSSGGLSIFFSRQDKHKFHHQEIINNVTLNWGTADVVIKAEVVGLKEIRPFTIDDLPYGGRRLSLKFIDLDDLTKKRIGKVITGHGKFLEDLLKEIKD